MLVALAIAAAIDGSAALRHASSLASLGPHPLGSPRAAAAAAYVASAFRDAGLADVRLQPFEAAGLRGSNVVAVLRGQSPEFIVIGAHHDTAAGTPGAYDGGGGVAVMLEAARVLAKAGARPRTLVFASWDGEEARAAGSRAYVKSLAAEAPNLVAALIVDMCGWKDGTPTLHPLTYSDPLRPGHTVVAPGWLVRAAARGSRTAGAPFAVGDPLLGLFSQPVTRVFRVGLFGDDLAFLQAGLPALMLSDSSLLRFYPDYHRPGDTPDKLEAEALARVGRGVLGAIDALSTSTREKPQQPTWLSLGSYVLGAPAVYALAFASLAPGFWVAVRAGRGPSLWARLAHAALFALLCARAPVPALVALALPNALAPLLPRLAGLATLSPLAVIAAIGGFAAWKNAGPEGPLVIGVWLEPWELTAAALALALAFVAPARGMARTAKPRAGKLRMRRRIG
jgi:hypothetical protein